MRGDAWGEAVTRCSSGKLTVDQCTCCFKWCGDLVASLERPLFHNRICHVAYDVKD